MNLMRLINLSLAHAYCNNLVSYHDLIRHIRLVSRFTYHLCNTIYFSTTFSTLRDENGRERSGNPLTVPVTVFFGRERKRERKNRTGKRNRYYGISGTESIGREHAGYDRESITQNGKIHTTTSNI